MVELKLTYLLRYDSKAASGSPMYAAPHFDVNCSERRLYALWHYCGLGP